MKFGAARGSVTSLSIALAFFTALMWSQSASVERRFPQSKSAVEKALKVLQRNMAGKLPTLDGFAIVGEHPLDRYQRGYYQASAVILPNSSGGSIVRIQVKVTAWYSDQAAGNSGYQLLRSNGRVESDLLDQLAEQLSGAQERMSPVANIGSTNPPSAPPDEHPAAPELERKFPNANGTLPSSLKGISSEPTTAEKSSTSPSIAKNPLQAEVDSLEQILKNTARPKNLVAVKKSGTPVVSTASLKAKPLFLASMHDEFELLDFNADWVHVRISGLSRGWIWRNSVEMPDGIADTTTSSTPRAAAAADYFHVVREEAAPFPGDWEPLRGKNVKIISVQQVDEAAKDIGSKEKLAYAKFLMDKSYNEIAEKKRELQGVVVIFDSADGGMIGATLPSLQQWRAGTLSDAAFWHKCFFDPPETPESSDSSGRE